MWALPKVVESLPTSVSDCHIVLLVGNHGVIHAWHDRVGHSTEVAPGARRIFKLITALNVAITLTYIPPPPSQANPADGFPRKLSRADSMLSPEYWNIIQRRIRGAAGHTLGLAALDSDVQRDLRGAPLLHFTPLSTPGSKEVDVFNQDLRNFDGTRVNAYVFLRLR